MSQFYQGMLRQNQSPAAALRQAQQQMWEAHRHNPKDPYQHPYYWAAFTIQGLW